MCRGGMAPVVTGALRIRDEFVHRTISCTLREPLDDAVHRCDYARANTPTYFFFAPCKFTNEYKFAIGFQHTLVTCVNPNGTPSERASSLRFVRSDARALPLLASLTTRRPIGDWRGFGANRRNYASSCGAPPNQLHYRRSTTVMQLFIVPLK